MKRLGGLWLKIRLVLPFPKLRCSLSVPALTSRSAVVLFRSMFLFTKEKFTRALQAMRPAFEAGLCVSDLVAVASEGERLGEVIVPEGRIGLATVCSIVLNGACSRRVSLWTLVSGACCNSEIISPFDLWSLLTMPVALWTLRNIHHG